MKLFCIIFMSHLSLCLANLLVISLDGFAHSYLDNLRAGALKALRDEGARAVNGMKSTFSPLTFPNHWTMATGLVQESHGVISNSFYDRKRGVAFSKDTKDANFYGGEAIWTTAKKAGLMVSVIIWPGVSAPRDKFNPDQVILYNRSISLESRIQLALKAAESHDLVMMYWDEPDRIGHEEGPYGSKRPEVINHIAKNLKRVMHKLSEKDNKLNLMVVSDHGMAEITNVTTLDLQVVLQGLASVVNDTSMVAAFNKTIITPTASVTHFYFTSDQFNPEGSAYLIRWQIAREAGDTKGLAEAKKAMKTGSIPPSSRPIKWKNVTFYLKSELPDRWFYRKSDNIGDLVAVADEGFFIELKKTVSLSTNGPPSLCPLDSNFHFFNHPRLTRRSMAIEATKEPTDTTTTCSLCEVSS